MYLGKSGNAKSNLSNSWRLIISEIDLNGHNIMHSGRQKFGSTSFWIKSPVHARWIPWVSLGEPWTKWAYSYPLCYSDCQTWRGGNLMVWGCFTAAETDPIVQRKQIMNQDSYEQYIINDAKPKLYSSGIPTFSKTMIQKYDKTRAWIP